MTGALSPQKGEYRRSRGGERPVPEREPTPRPALRVLSPCGGGNR
jgi:hypothetical protein